MKQYKCPSCGSELNIDDKNKEFAFCQFCGTKIMLDDHRSTYRVIDEAKIHETETKQMIRMREMNLQKELWEKERVEREIDKFKTSKLFKILLVAILVSIIVAFISFSKSEILIGVIAVIQTLLFGMSWLIKLRVIKEKKNNLHILFIIIGIILFLPQIKLSGFSFDNLDEKDNLDWSVVFLGDEIPEPKSKKINVSVNTEEEFDASIKKVSKNDYYEYVSECKNMGFDNEMKEYSNSFEAYNDNGYYLTIYSYSTSNEIHLILEAPTEMTNLNWDNHDIAKVLPKPDSQRGAFDKDNEKRTDVIVGNTSVDEFKNYKELCINSGFVIDSKQDTKSYESGTNKVA